MALITIDLNLNESQIEMIRDLFKYIVIFVIFHILSSLSKTKNYGLGGELLNEQFLNFILMIFVSILGYYLVINELLSIQ